MKSIIFFLILCVCMPLYAVDTFVENFDSRQDDTTIDGVSSWNVIQGTASNAVTQDSNTFSGSGKALELTGAETNVIASRGFTDKNVSPCWVEFIVNPGLGSESNTLPTGKIAALSFDYRGIIYASNGSSWVDTGETFTENTWYRCRLKLDFTTHLYDLYIEPVAEPKVDPVPSLENLSFINASISSLNEVGFEGAYSVMRNDDTYIDDLLIHFVDRLEIITPAQTLIQDEVSIPITVQLQSSYSQAQTAWEDITLELKSSSAKSNFSLNKDNWSSISQITIPENSQQASFYYKDSTEGLPLITVKEYPDRGWDQASQQEKIVAEVNYFDVAVITPIIAGQDFTIEITAKDENGNINKLYSNNVDIITKYISPPNGTKQITPNNVSGFSNGKLQINAAYPDCGVIEIVVQDINDSSKIGSSLEILFIPAQFNISIKEEGSKIVSKEFAISLSALNNQGQACPNYQGPANLSAKPISPEQTSGLISPAAISSEEFSQGIIEKNISFNRWGTIKIEVSDENYPQQKGTSQLINFLPKALVAQAEAPAAERDFYYVGETIPVLISAIDESEEPIPNYQGLINISTTVGLYLGDEYNFTDDDEGSHTFTTSVTSAGIYEVLAEDKDSELKSNVLEIEVKDAKLRVIDTVAPIGTTEVIIELVDEDGNIIDSEDDLTLTVELEEEYADSSAASSSTRVPVTFRNGRATILVSNSQAETVTISPFSEFDFKTSKGTVTFGRIAKTGVGSLMWRELKE